MADFVEVVGLSSVLARLDPALWSKGVHLGLQRAGSLAIEPLARRNVEKHHDRGNAAQNLHTEVVGSGMNAEARIGVSVGLVPEGRPLEFGWKSGSGKQPPTAAIAAWLTRHPEAAGSPLVSRNSSGFVRRQGTVAQVSQDAQIRGRAFVIARAIGKRGYSFGSIHWLSDAGRDGASEAASILRATIAETVRAA